MGWWVVAAIKAAMTGGGDRGSSFYSWLNNLR